jgi:putative peptidoglycan lipid II flippase
LYYADRLMEFPLGVFSIALATVILPGLSRNHAESSPERFTATLDWALRLVILLVSPAAVAMLAFAGPLTATTLGYGAFGARDVEMASLALMAYSWGLIGFSLVKVLAPGYFARQDTRTPVRIGLQSLGVNMGLNVAIVLPLALTHNQPGLHALLALNNGLGAWYNSSMLYRGLRRQGVLTHGPGWKPLWMRVLVANLAMVAFLWWFAGNTGAWLAMSAWQRVLHMSVLVAGGGAIYFGAMFALGLRVRDLKVRPVARPPGAGSEATGADDGTGPGSA